jgi:glycine C-acetyltransferase
MKNALDKTALDRRLAGELEQFRTDGVYKRLNYLDSPQGPRVRMEGRGDVIILSSNNYLGLSNDPAVVAAGKAALDRFGAGTASVRFICGTFTVHRALEEACARLVGTEASLSFVSCWNANEATPGTLLGENDIVISDQLNHASIIDGIRLAKAITKCQTAVYRHADLGDLDEKLAASKDRRTRMVITDGIFSMEGAIAKLPDLVALCRKHDAVLVVDDSHATGVLGATGRGTAEHFGMVGEVDIITSTLGKALGGAAGGFVAASAEVCDYLTQRPRRPTTSRTPLVPARRTRSARPTSSRSASRRPRARSAMAAPRRSPKPVRPPAAWSTATGTPRSW